MNAIVQRDRTLEQLLTELEFDIHGLAEYRISTGWRVSLPAIGLCGICYVSGSPCRLIVGRSPAVLLPPPAVVPLAVVPFVVAVVVPFAGSVPVLAGRAVEVEVR